MAEEEYFKTCSRNDFMQVLSHYLEGGRSRYLVYLADVPTTYDGSFQLEAKNSDALLEMIFYRQYHAQGTYFWKTTLETVSYAFEGNVLTVKSEDAERIWITFSDTLAQ